MDILGSQKSEWPIFRNQNIHFIKNIYFLTYLGAFKTWLFSDKISIKKIHFSKTSTFQFSSFENWTDWSGDFWDLDKNETYLSVNLVFQNVDILDFENSSAVITWLWCSVYKTDLMGLDQKPDLSSPYHQGCPYANPRIMIWSFRLVRHEPFIHPSGVWSVRSAV